MMVGVARAALLACVFAVAAAPCVASAQSTTPQRSAVADVLPNRPLKIELQSAASVLAPGMMAEIAIRFRPEPGWHTYWRYSGDVGSAPSVNWQLPAGFVASPLRWPVPTLIASPPLASYGYEREVHLSSSLRVPSTVRAGSGVTLAGTVSWVACKIECVAGDVRLALTLQVGTVPVVDTAVTRALETEASRVPARVPDWTFRAAVDSSSLLLRVHPAPGARRFSLADAAQLRFFIDSAEVIDHAAPIDVVTAGADLELRLRRSEYARGTPTRITGVLVLPDTASARGTPRLALEVDAPIVPMWRSPAPSASSSQVPEAREHGERMRGWRGLATAAVLALLGGTLLNLMPCVLPVLSIKAIGLAAAAEQDARDARRHVTLYAAGVLVSMWVLVGVLLALRAVGTEVGWGYQLQSSWVVGGLALLLLAAALNLAGVFELLPVGGAISAASRRAPRDGEAFLSGVLVTALATPCSAPFLASAVAFAITTGSVAAFVVFTALGLGLVWPVALIAIAPPLGRWLPRPGEWMITLRQVLAFPLLATVVWLAWVMGRQSGVDAMAMLLMALTVLAFGLWALGHVGTVLASAGRRRVARGVAVLSAAVALALLAIGVDASAPAVTSRTAATPITRATSARRRGDALPWRPYSATALEALRDSGRVVLLDFTADWCLTCKVNDRVAFGSDDVRAALRHDDVALVRADWTTRDPAVTRALAGFGRSSVPLVVLYSRDHAAPPEILPTLLTPRIVTASLDRAARRIGADSVSSAVAAIVPNPFTRIP